MKNTKVRAHTSNKHEKCLKKGVLLFRFSLNEKWLKFAKTTTTSLICNGRQDDTL